MAKNSNTRRDTFEKTCIFISKVKERTINDWISTGDVFTGQINGNKVPLITELGISNENTVNIFILAGLLEVNQNETSKYGCKIVRWCGSNMPIEKMTEHFISVRNKYIATRPKKTKIITPIKTTTIIQSPITGDITREEFRNTVYGGTKSDTESQLLQILNEIFRHLNSSPRSKHNIFKMYMTINGMLRFMDVRDMFGKRKSVISTQLLMMLGILKLVKGMYVWSASTPDNQMVKNICFEDAYNAYIVKERNKVVIEEVNTPVIAEAETDSPKPHFMGTFIVTQENSEGIKLEDMTVDQKLNFIGKQEVRNIEFQIEISKNLLAISMLLEKVVRGE